MKKEVIHGLEKVMEKWSAGPSGMDKTQETVHYAVCIGPPLNFQDGALPAKEDLSDSWDNYILIYWVLNVLG